MHAPGLDVLMIINREEIWSCGDDESNNITGGIVEVRMLSNYFHGNEVYFFCLSRSYFWVIIFYFIYIFCSFDPDLTLVGNYFFFIYFSWFLESIKPSVIPLFIEFHLLIPVSSHILYIAFVYAIRIASVLFNYSSYRLQYQHFAFVLYFVNPILPFPK